MSTSPITQKKALAGYVAATQRDRCGSCSWATEDANFWTCRKHGFMVTVYAVCNDWKSRVPAAFKSPP